MKVYPSCFNGPSNSEMDSILDTFSASTIINTPAYAIDSSSTFFAVPGGRQSRGSPQYLL
eukprot:scaffold1685_cov134-Skeletonema_marinoi.AAC.2